MRLRIKNYWLMAVLSLLSATFLTQCTSDDDEDQLENVLEVDSSGYSNMNNNALQSQLNRLPKEELSSEEKTGLTFMREEEKLAHDVYVQLYQKWNKRVFDNIAESEWTHSEAVLLLLDKYDLTDPVGSNGIGLFANASLQQLHDDLFTAGSISITEALKAGCAIEEIDILDLQNQMDVVVDNQDITLLYKNLQKGSRNHLRAFVKNLENIGISYQPQYMSQEAYDDIVKGGLEMGG